MDDIRKLTDKYKAEGMTLEAAINKAYTAASRGYEDGEEGSSQHVRHLAERNRLTLLKGQVRQQVDVTAETRRLMRDEGLSLEQATNRAYLMATGGDAA